MVLSLSGQMSVRILQLTDCHLMADPRAELKGICTRERFAGVLSDIATHHADVDLLVVSGDLTHDERPETYVAIREMLAEWLPRLRVIPGNHDDREPLRQTFRDQIQQHAERLVFVHDLGGWRLIGLDSHRPGELSGELGAEQLAWLDEQLGSEPLRPTGLFVHHPPISVNSVWLDRIGLIDADSLLTVLRRHAQVRFVSCGHVHQERSAVIGSIQILTTPSTGVQFRPETAALEVDVAEPGYRVFSLLPDGQFQSWVERVGTTE